MGKLAFVVLCDEDPASITQEVDIQVALAGAMRSLAVPFTLIPPDVSSPGLTVETRLPVNGVVSFQDVPRFTSCGSYAVDQSCLPQAHGFIRGLGKPQYKTCICGCSML